MRNLNLGSLLLAVLLSVCSTPLWAQDKIIGTGALGSLSGIYNLYYQGRLYESGGFTIEFARANKIKATDDSEPLSATGVGVAYKHYIEKYLWGTYAKIGMAIIDVKSGDESGGGLMPLLLAGYETEFGGRFLFGVEAGLGTTAGIGIFGINLGMKL